MAGSEVTKVSLYLRHLPSDWLYVCFFSLGHREHSFLLLWISKNGKCSRKSEEIWTAAEAVSLQEKMNFCSFKLCSKQYLSIFIQMYLVWIATVWSLCFMKMYRTDYVRSISKCMQVSFCCLVLDDQWNNTVWCFVGMKANILRIIDFFFIGKVKGNVQILL